MLSGDNKRASTRAIQPKWLSVELVLQGKPRDLSEDLKRVRTEQSSGSSRCAIHELQATKSFGDECRRNKMEDQGYEPVLLRGRAFYRETGPKAPRLEVKPLPQDSVRDFLQYFEKYSRMWLESRAIVWSGGHGVFSN